jgi:hypothetical protein
MKKRLTAWTILVVSLGSIVSFILWFDHQGMRVPLPFVHKRAPVATQPRITPDREAQLNQQIRESQEKAQQFFSHRIDFYGIVHDEKGQPVSGAEVVYKAPSSLAEAWKDEGKQGGVSGPDGKFAITGQRSGGITVWVRHPDYYTTERSLIEMTYGDSDPPTRDKPAEFILRKKGVTEALVKMEQRPNIPRDGSHVAIGLQSKDAKDIELWTWFAPDAANKPREPYDWKLHLSVPAGGLIAYENQFQFEAPRDGYALEFMFEMPAKGRDGRRWTSSWKRSFFVRLVNGHYARFNLEMYCGGPDPGRTGGDNFAVIESYYNPSGSRNLEYDPAKKIEGKP